MFILRKITENKLEWNFCLGESYSIIDRDRNPTLFNETAQAYNYFDNNEICAFVFDSLGAELPLYRSHENYIMTDSGKTFAHILKI